MAAFGVIFVLGPEDAGTLFVDRTASGLEFANRRLSERSGGSIVSRLICGEV